MMFENGITSYVYGKAEVVVAFPVDKQGVPHVVCSQCYYHSESTNRCRLNNEVCAFPNKYIGGACPLKFNDSMEDE